MTISEYIIVYTHRHSFQDTPSCTRSPLPAGLTVWSEVITQDSQAYCRALFHMILQILSMTLPVYLPIHFSVRPQHDLKFTLNMHKSLPQSTYTSEIIHQWVHPQTHSQSCCQGYSKLHLIVHSQPAWLFASKYTLQILLRILASMLWSTLSRGKTLPISPEIMLICSLQGAQLKDLLSSQCQIPRDWRQAAGGVLWSKLWC